MAIPCCMIKGFHRVKNDFNWRIWKRLLQIVLIALVVDLFAWGSWTTYQYMFKIGKYEPVVKHVYREHGGNLGVVWTHKDKILDQSEVEYAVSQYGYRVEWNNPTVEVPVVHVIRVVTFKNRKVTDENEKDALLKNGFYEIHKSL